MKAELFSGVAGTIGVADDGLIQRLLSAASMQIASYLGRIIVCTPTAVVENTGGNGSTRAKLKRWPVTAVASAVLNGQTVPQWIPGQGPLLIPGATPAGAYGWTPLLWDGLELVPPTSYLLMHGGGRWSQGTNNLVISYTAGFTGLAGTGPGAIPFDLENACIEMTMQAYKQKARMGLSSETAPGGQTASGYITKMLPSIIAQLAPYRNVVPG